MDLVYILEIRARLHMGIFLRTKKNLLVSLLLALFTLQSFASITTTSATFDEVQYFGMGKYLLLNQKWDVMGSIMSPPLAYYLNSIPLLFVSEDKSLWEYRDVVRDVKFLSAVDAVRGQGMLSSSVNEGDRMLILTRLMTLLLSLLLGYFVFRFSRDLYGENAGLLSLFLFAFCPNMLAHSGLITTDMPFTVFSFLAVYCFRSFLHSQTIKKALIAAIPLGCALATKFTAMLLLPFLLLMYVLYQYREKKGLSVHIFLLIAVAVFIFAASYGFNMEPFILGNERRLTQLSEGFASFLYGNYSGHGWWYFYFVTFLIKTPIPLLLLFVTASVWFWRDTKKDWIDLIWLFLPIAIIFMVFSVSRVSIGLRYLLPIYPFIFVIAGRLALVVNKFRIPLCLLAVWYVVGTICIAPHYLAYFNEIIGGPGNGYKYLVDSNLDWGQDLKGLKKYMDSNGINRVSLSYFGIDSPGRYGIEYDWLPSHHLFNPNPESPVVADKNRFVAISVTNLQGLFIRPIDTFAWLKSFEPVAKIGFSIFVYDLEKLEPVR